MKYLSVCSGIEAASVAWHPLRWQAVAYAEIEAFPSAVLAHHYPETPNYGDMTRFKEWPDADIDLLVGGTPCQSFSVAGLRKGLDDPRGNLALTYLALVDRYRPSWVVWENVPGVLSSDDGGALGAFLGGLAELGYGFAYRVLDAQYFGLAQRRARVFVVGHLGDWRRAAAVLFERESLSGHPAPRREAGEDVTGTLSSRASASGGLGTDLDCANGVILERTNERTNERTSVPHRAMCLNAGGMGRIDAESETLIPIGGAFDVAGTLKANNGGGGWSNSADHAAAGYMVPVAHSLRADGFDASEDGTGRGTPLIPLTFINPRQLRNSESSNQVGIKVGADIVDALCSDGPGAIAFSVKDHGADAGELSPTLRAGGHDGSHANGGVMPAVAFANTTDLGYREEQALPVTGRHGDPGNVMRGMQVRRLTPRECERLQGFPDDYTLIPYRGRPAADGPRYKALGNSMAVPVMAWIGRRIQMVQELKG